MTTDPTPDSQAPFQFSLAAMLHGTTRLSVLLALAPVPDTRVVIDPVLTASDGSALLERRAYPALRDLVFGRCLLTPNWPEAEILIGGSLPRRRDGEAAARQLIEDLEL